MATVSNWTPFGVALNITATGSTVTRKSATQYTVKINVSWKTQYSGAKTNYGMLASSGGGSATINPVGTKASSGSGSFTGTYSISGNGSATKTITVTFKNYAEDWQGNVTDSATKTVSFTVTVPAWTSYTVSYNANGGSGAPSSQTKWKDQTLTLSSTKPTRTGYTFLGWNSSSTATGAQYNAGGSYTNNASVTLYAVWKANTYTVKFDANGGSGAPASQTKTYDVTLTLSSTKPTRTNYNFKGWGTTASATTVSYAAGASYTTNAAITLYAIWELAYIKPRITSFTVERCDSDGMVNNKGLYALVKFSWACDYTVSSIKIEWKLATASSYSSSATVTASGTSGTVSQVVGAGALSTSSTYTVRVTVADSNGSSEKTATLNSFKFTINAKPGGNGIAFGKVAELENVADMNFQFRTLVGILQPVLESGTDLDTLFIPNVYTLKSMQASEYTCGENALPISTGTGRLIIESFGDEGQVKQTIEVCHKTAPLRYERFYYQSAWGNWCEAGECKSAITAALSGDTTLGVVNTYTKIPFATARTKINSGLSISDGCIKVGAGINQVRISAQLKTNCGTTTGNRHARLAKNSGGTVTYLAWNHINVRNASDTIALVFTPYIASVQEGDLLYMVFYTPDATDVNYMGHSANGVQTYLTVESI